MKKLLVAATAGIFSTLLMSGCANIKEMNKALGEATTPEGVSTTGLSITQGKTTQEDVLKTIGAPSMTFATADGTTWVYSRVAVRNNGADGSIAANFTAIFPYQANTRSKGGGIAGAGVEAAVSSRSSSYKTAGLLINFDENGCVVNYEYTATSF